MVVALAGGGAGLVYAGALLTYAWRARSWPSVEGEIAATRLVRRETIDGDTGHTTERDYRYVSYRYSVAGQPYRNDRVVFGPAIVPRSILPGVDPEPHAPEAAARLAAEFPRGRRIRVYYNPRDPADSVLYPAVGVFVWLIAFVSLVFLWFALGQL